ncbi:imidazole glycerol phosphate synthase subunit HisH [Candidatus Pacearchaeota archaeon]|nr:imidazole glycerol phosphate synthase subunit HisH [Candidatus Pacearchaeota archaeon]
MAVLIIDYGMSNLSSIKRALEECGADVFISDNPKDIKKAERVVLPGVGAFADGMMNLNNRGWTGAIKEEVLTNKIPLLGVCLGMQLLADKGYEGGETEGLGLIPGEVSILNKKNESERIPHIGWNEIKKVRHDKLLDGISDNSDFYFVHSYSLNPKDNYCILAETPHCGSFVSIVKKDKVYGVQFHPEKSSSNGFLLLKNFLRV